MAGPKTPRKVPTQARARATVDAILTATGELAAQGGLENLSISAIARRAGVGMGTLYQYFGSLEAVTAAWEERGFAEDAETFTTFLRDLLGEHLEMEVAIPKTVTMMVDLIHRRMRFYGEPRRADLMSRFVERVRIAKTGVDAVVATLETAPDRGRLRTADLRTAAYLLFMSVVAVSYDLAVTGASADDVARARSELGTMAVRYLLGA